MIEKYVSQIAELLGIKEWQVKNTLELLEEKATIPFISRYRKEMTGSLDEVEIGKIRDSFAKLKEIDERRDTILDSIGKQGKLNDDLEGKIVSAKTLTELEDIYLPYKPKRKTRASVARENGLEPLANDIINEKNIDLETTALNYINENVEDTEDALQGARDIIAETISENQRARNKIRYLFGREALITSKLVKGKEEEAEKYKDYFDFNEPLKKCPSHRLLAIQRAVKEGFLRINIAPDEENAIEMLEDMFIKGPCEAAEQKKIAIKDGYKRLLQPSIETEYNKLAKEKADEESIKVFVLNLRQLLLAPPLGEKRVLAIDPGYRTGCKVVCLDASGNLLHNETIYPHKPQQQTKQSIRKVASLVNAYAIEAIAIGNGTASRETEHFIQKVKFDRKVQVFVVNEAGASVYSASSVAREEFPQYDVTVRGAVSIGRRLMDPLAELVKIDPKSIGVGQYQHDVDQNKLKESLNEVVESCVNSVGVDLNTASKHLLTYVSGLGPQLAQNIVEYRKENGAFRLRKDLLKVARMGKKSYEQAAGFLRISNPENPLDNSAVHPESYHIVEKMAKDLNVEVKELLSDELLRKKIDIKNYVTEKAGIPTLTDIMKEIAKPGRDPRTTIKRFEFKEGIFSIDDIEPGMVLPGIVTNITNFGAFVDIGIKINGLIHVSQMAERFVSNPAEIVALHQHLKVKVTEVDKERKRIQLSLIGVDQAK